jgi:hypothetical protein
MNRGLNDPTAGIDLNQPTIELSDEEIDAFRTKVGEIAGLVSEYLTDMFDINSSINQSEGEVTGLITVHHPGTQPMGTQISAGSIKQEHGEVRRQTAGLNGELSTEPRTESTKQPINYARSLDILTARSRSSNHERHYQR